MSAKKKKKITEEEIVTAQGQQEDAAEEAATPQVDKELRATIDRLQRLQAEFENYKKRAMRDACALEERITDRLLLEFLPLYDSLQMAFKSLRAEGDTDAFARGMEKIFSQFQQMLDAKGVSRIETENQPFDPAMHEAMLGVPSVDVEKNMILEEFLSGYMRDERVLRPSRVSVSQGAPLCEEEDE